MENSALTYKFCVGDRVVFTNDFGVCWGIRTVMHLDERTGGPTYHAVPTDCPWFSVPERNFTLATAEDEEAAKLPYEEMWTYFQEKYGFKPTLEQLGGCS